MPLHALLCQAHGREGCATGEGFFASQAAFRAHTLCRSEPIGIRQARGKLAYYEMDIFHLNSLPMKVT